jgi:hypothetical protein
MRLAREFHHRGAEAHAHIGLATVGSDPARAVGHATTAVEVARAAGLRVVEGQALTALTAAYLAAGRPRQAGIAAKHAIAIHRETGHHPGVLRTRRLLSEGT